LSTIFLSQNEDRCGSNEAQSISNGRTDTFNNISYTIESKGITEDLLSSIIPKNCGNNEAKDRQIAFVGEPTNVKKMCPKNSTLSSVSKCLSFSMPRLVKGKSCYIIFYAFDPASGKMKRFRTRINHLAEKKRDLEKVSRVIINNLSNRLMSGWNPFIDSASDMNYAQFEDICFEYSEYIKKLCNEGTLREKTMYGYERMRLALMTWNSNRKIPITYIYQFKKKIVAEFLDHIYVEKGNSARTRNNYLTWLKVFSNWLQQRDYIDSMPTESISAIRVTKEKNRTIIPDEKLQQLYSYLENHNRYYLLACYLLYYTMIRPKEMAKLKLEYFSIKEQTILIPGSISKNKRTSTVTIPQKVIFLMIDLGIFNNPSNFYLFSKDFKPGLEFVTEKKLSDYWVFKIRRNLGFPLEYKFYSLKDSGITTMLHKEDVLTVRNQARHSSISITNAYASGITGANPDLKNYDGSL